MDCAVCGGGRWYAQRLKKLQRVSVARNVPIKLLSSTLSNPTETITNMAKAKAGISDEPQNRRVWWEVSATKALKA